MTARLPSDKGKTRLTLSAAEEDTWRDARTDALAERRAQILGGARPWGVPATHHIVHDPAAPRHIDWWRVLALLILFGAAALTFLGGYLAIVYVLTAF